MIKREARWKLLKIVLILYMVYAAVRMVFYGQGSLQSVIFDLGRIVLLVLLLWWLNTRSEMCIRDRLQGDETFEDVLAASDARVDASSATK